MPNANYLAGRRLEYDIMADWRKKGYEVARTAGSHGAFDVIAWDATRRPEFIQCKRVSDKASAKRLLAKFKATTQSSYYLSQVMVVKVKGTKWYESVTI